MTSIIQKVVPQLWFDRGSTPNTNIVNKKQEHYFAATSTDVDDDDIRSGGTTTPPPPPYEKTAMTTKRFSETRATAISPTPHQQQGVNIGEETPSSSPRQASMINTTLISQSMTLIQIAAEMQSSRQMAMALDLYMVALDKMMTALPLDTDTNAKRSLRDKLKEIKERYDLDHDHEEDIQYTISESIIHAAIACAVALKKSPIPDMVTSVLNYAVSSIHSIDKMLNVRERSWHLVSCGVTKLTQVDQHYQIHQMVTSAVYTSAMAIFKAGIAYTETPSYSEAKKHKTL